MSNAKTIFLNMADIYSTKLMLFILRTPSELLVLSFIKGKEGCIKIGEAQKSGRPEVPSNA